MSESGEKEHWSVDKKIPAALVITLLLQTGGIVWWVSSLNSRVTVVEEKAIATRLDIDKLKDVSGEAKERFARTETTLISVVETTRRVESKLDRLLDDRQPARANGPR
ncbi:hypothetical protein ACETRX_22985 [Labrys portucalensis]|uniref:Uncharacterized protein n=1 Tax=Labrys neptuniae TaxID=376174 RepID=A0ABV6ZK07_9HYPH